MLKGSGCIVAPPEEGHILVPNAPPQNACLFSLNIGTADS